MANIHKSLGNFKKSLEPKIISYYGFLGIPIDGIETVNVPERPGFVYVRLNGNLSDMVEAYNDQVSPVYDLPVMLVRDGNRFKITGRDLGIYDNWGYSAYVPLHGGTHAFGGTDTVWVYSEQFYPLSVNPFGTSGAGVFNIGPHVYNWNGSWKSAGGTGTSDASVYQPTGSSSQKIMLLYIDGPTSNPTWMAGSEAPFNLTLKNDLIPYLPNFQMGVGIPLAMVRIPSGTSTFSWDMLYDVRQYFLGGQTGSNGFPEAPIDGTPYARQDAGWVSAGDVIGPVGAVDSNFASFETATGKLIKDSGYGPDSFAPSGTSASVPSGTYPLAVNPSIIDNFVSFDSVIGGQKDSGYGPNSFQVSGSYGDVFGNITGTNGHLVKFVTDGYHLGDGEAPIDGYAYGRKNAAWTIVTGSSGGSGDVIGPTGSTSGHVAVFGADQYHILDGNTTVREKLISDRTYYVRTDGNDGNTGLVDSAGGAFLTIQHAINVAAGLDSSIYDIYINIDDGTYVEDLDCKNLLGSGSVFVLGASSDATLVIIDGGISKGTPGTVYSFEYMTSELTLGASEVSFKATNGALILFNHWIFAGGYLIHIIGADGGTIVCDGGEYEITDGAGFVHIYASAGNVKVPGATVTVTGNPEFTVFVDVESGGMVVANGGASFTGAAVGSRFYVNPGGVIDPGGDDLTFFPGDAAGDISAGGLYGSIVAPIVVGNASVTDGHLAVFDTDGYHIKDGGAVPVPGMTLIADIVVTGADAATIDFSSIPATYKYLVIHYSLRTDVAANFDALKVTVNNDSGNNYDVIRLSITHSASLATAEAYGEAPPNMAGITGNNATANYFATGQIHFTDYTNAVTFKSFNLHGGVTYAGSAGQMFVREAYGAWKSTSAINRLTFAPVTGTKFKVNSRITLYGLG